MFMNIKYEWRKYNPDGRDYHYTWKRQDLDIRDYSFSRLGLTTTLKELPPVINLRRWCSYIEDQERLGSCTANAWGSLLEYNENRYRVSGEPYIDLSRLFIYYNERVIDGSINEDAGAYLVSGAKALRKWGVCPEYKLPYKINKFTERPSDLCYDCALGYRIKGYYRLRTLRDMKTSLSNGMPFVFGFLVFESFETNIVANTGIVPVPDVEHEQVLGGHAVMAVGYNDYQRRFLVRNSWGRDWGLKGTNAGYFTMPYDYITDSDLAGDFWTVTR